MTCGNSEERDSRLVTLPRAAVRFPPRCVRCGRPSKFEANIRAYQGGGLLLQAVLVHLHLQTLFLRFHIPFFHKPAPMVLLRVPVCRRCRELHSCMMYSAVTAAFLAVFMAVAILLIVLYDGDLGWPVYLTIVVVAVALGLMCFCYVDKKMLSALDMRVLGVRVQCFSRDADTVSLRFKDLALAQETARLSGSEDTDAAL